MAAEIFDIFVCVPAKLKVAINFVSVAFNDVAAGDGDGAAAAAAAAACEKDQLLQQNQWEAIKNLSGF